jgi:hypothetical protein
MIATGHLQIEAGSTWKEIDNSGDIIAIQNVSGCILEYSYTDGVTYGSQLTPYKILENIEQPIYVRFLDNKHSGYVLINRGS